MQVNAPNVLSASPMDPCFLPCTRLLMVMAMVSKWFQLITSSTTTHKTTPPPSPPPNWHIMLLRPCEACEASNDGGVNERKKQMCDPKTHMLQQNLTMLQTKLFGDDGSPSTSKTSMQKKEKKTSMLEFFL